MTKTKIVSVVLAAALALPGIAASAKDGKADTRREPVEVKHSLFSGSESRLADLGWLRPDCTSPIADVRVVKSPANGDVRFEQTRSTITAKKGPLQKLCHGKAIDAVRVLYKANANFVGTDKFVLDVDTKLGVVKRYTYVMDVTGNTAAAQDSTGRAAKSSSAQIGREVFTGNESRIAAMNYVNADCSPGPVPALRIVTAPQNGEYRLEEMTIPVDRRANDSRASCNGKPVTAVAVFYKSKAGFNGEDTMAIDVDFKSGFIRHYDYKITVR
jgi:hypothetical protein